MIRFFSSSIFLIIVLVPLFSVNLNAQEEQEEFVPISIRLSEFSLDYIKPINTFGTRMNNNAIGGSGTFLWQTKPESPTYLGFDIYWARYYSISTTFQDVIDGILEDIGDFSKTNVAGTDFIARYFPFTSLSFIEPYVEGMLGLNYLHTVSSLQILSTNENIDFEFAQGAVSISYGGSAGIQFRVYQDKYYANLKASYLRGTSNKFLAIPEGADPSNISLANLAERNAPIDVLRFQAGVSISF